MEKKINNMTDINIISIHYGHNATAALLQNGEIKFCISEERFNRIKNSTGFPYKVVDFLKNKCDQKVNYYVITQKSPAGYNYLKKYNFKAFNFGEKNKIKNEPIPLKLLLFPNHFYRKYLEKIKNGIKKLNNDTALMDEMNEYFSNILKIEKEKIIYLDHHKAHALSTIFFEKNNNNKLIFSLDGEGDGLCATVSVKNNENIKIICKINRAFSLGYLYREVTAFLGMKPDEHEFKVMGMAPYAKDEYIEKLLPIFTKVLWLNKNDEFESIIPMQIVKHYLKENLLYQRFDNIAGAIQKFTENIVIEWIKRWVNKTNIKDISLAGGVFMNVKMNQKISEMKEVSSITITPSSGDESLVIGCCYYGYQKYCAENNVNFDIQRIDNLYLGNEYEDEEIEKFLKENNYFNKYKITKPANINKVIALLLAQNEVVARFFGRMEFGARALGNRSILSNPSSYENIRIINEMIKNRDFWMPFATSILEEEENAYLLNPKKINAEHMIITFNTTEKAKKELIAAIHPYDKTSRPQIVRKEINKNYYEIIKEFKNKTGIGGVLNTSFNLHGEPNVESPRDAMHTFENSGLQYMALNSFLIEK